MTRSVRPVIFRISSGNFATCATPAPWLRQLKVPSVGCGSCALLASQGAFRWSDQRQRVRPSSCPARLRSPGSPWPHPKRNWSTPATTRRSCQPDLPRPAPTRVAARAVSRALPRTSSWTLPWVRCFRFAHSRQPARSLRAFLPPQHPSPQTDGRRRGETTTTPHMWATFRNTRRRGKPHPARIRE